MTEQELQEQLELQNRTIAELKAKADQIQKDYDAKLAAANAAPKLDDATKAKIAELESKAKENDQLKNQLFVSGLEKKYPLVDLTLVPAGTPEQMEANAAKLQAFAEKHRAAAPAPNPAPAPRPGERWNGVGPMGGVQTDLEGEASRKAELDKRQDAAHRAGDVKGVFDAVLERQAPTVKALLASIDPAAAGK